MSPQRVVLTPSIGRERLEGDATDAVRRSQLLGLRKVGWRTSTCLDRSDRDGPGSLPGAKSETRTLKRFPRLTYLSSVCAQVDRKEDFYQNWGLTFPHQDGPRWNHSNVVLDGELVIDVDPQTQEVSGGVPSAMFHSSSQPASIFAANTVSARV